LIAELDAYRELPLPRHGLPSPSGKVAHDEGGPSQD